MVTCALREMNRRKYINLGPGYLRLRKYNDKLVVSTTNRYSKCSRISEGTFRELVRYFSLDLDAQKIVILTGLNRNIVNRYLQLIRNAGRILCAVLPVSRGDRDRRILLWRQTDQRATRPWYLYGKTPVF